MGPELYSGAFDAAIASYFPQWKEDLGLLLAEVSLDDPSSAGENAPFGRGLRAAFDRFAAIAERRGFFVHDCGGYAIDARMGPDCENDARPYVGVLGHLDTVGIFSPDEWQSPPFVLSEREGQLFGRGVNDDKGPLLLALYAAFIVKESGQPLLRPLRVIAGGAEESSWDCVHTYFSRHPQPEMAFSPDGDFPLVNHELGILDVCLEFPPHAPSPTLPLKALFSPVAKHQVCAELALVRTNDAETERSAERFPTRLVGQSALSRHPERGVNALDLFLDLLLEAQRTPDAQSPLAAHPLLNFYQRYLHVSLSSGERSTDKLLPEALLQRAELRRYFSQCATAVHMDDEQSLLYLDLRYPHPLEEGELLAHVAQLAAAFGGKLSVLRACAPLFCSEESVLLQKLTRAYRSVTGETPTCLTKGGASYARALTNALAFGPSFPEDKPASHEANERLSLQSARRALAIYCEAIQALCCEE